jgi:hypothetical protein
VVTPETGVLMPADDPHQELTLDARRILNGFKK